MSQAQHSPPVAQIGPAPLPATNDLPVITAEWQAALRRQALDRRQTDRLVMNFLEVNGFHDAARELQRESGICPSAPLQSIAERVQVRQHIVGGRIEEAVQLAGEMCPNLFPQDLRKVSELHFRLLVQQLVELIRTGDTRRALEFSQKRVAPVAVQHPQLLPQFESAMALLMFSVDGQPLPLHNELRQPLLRGRRNQLAKELNAAILNYQNPQGGQAAHLTRCLQLLGYSQSQLAAVDQFLQIADPAEEHLPRRGWIRLLRLPNAAAAPDLSPMIDEGDVNEDEAEDIDEDTGDDDDDDEGRVRLRRRR